MRWYDATDREVEAVTSLLLNAAFRAAETAATWTRLTHRTHAKKNFKRNLRNAEVRYAALRHLRPGFIWPRLEAELEALRAHDWAAS